MKRGILARLLTTIAVALAMFHPSVPPKMDMPNVMGSQYKFTEIRTRDETLNPDEPPGSYWTTSDGHRVNFDPERATPLPEFVAQSVNTAPYAPHLPYETERIETRIPYIPVDITVPPYGLYADTLDPNQGTSLNLDYLLENPDNLLDAYYQYLDPQGNIATIQSAFTTEVLNRNEDIASLFISASIFVERLPENQPALVETIERTVQRIGEAAGKSQTTFEKAIDAIDQLTIILQGLHAEHPEYEDAILAGIRFNADMLQIMHDDLIAKDSLDLVKMVGIASILYAILNRLNTLLEFFLNVKKILSKRSAIKHVPLKEKDPEKLEKLVILLGKLEKKFLEALRKGWPEMEKFKKGICEPIIEYMKVSGGRLPDEETVLRIWDNFGCEDYHLRMSARPLP